MFRVDSGYHGVSTIDLTSHSNFSASSELLSQHEDSYIVERDDTKVLLNTKVKDEEVSKELAFNYSCSANHRYSKNEVRKYTQGATFVNIADMIVIQLCKSSPDQNIHVVIGDDDLSDTQPQLSRQIKDMRIRKYWSIRISIL